VLRLSGDSEKILSAVICKPHKGMVGVLRPNPDIQIFDTGLLSLAAVRSLWEHASPAVLRPVLFILANWQTVRAKWQTMTQSLNAC